MRRLLAVLANACLVLAAAPAWTHGEEEDLAQHWATAEYRSEMWFQTLVIALVVALYVIAILAVRAWRRWSVYRR